MKRYGWACSHCHEILYAGSSIYENAIDQGMVCPFCSTFYKLDPKNANELYDKSENLKSDILVEKYDPAADHDATLIKTEGTQAEMNKMVRKQLESQYFNILPGGLSQKATYGYAAYRGEIPGISKENGFEIVKEAANRGSKAALLYLGLICIKPDSNYFNPAEAERCFKKSIELGCYESAYCLAMAYQQGSGVPKNFTKAFEYMKIAAENHIPHAATTLGSMYHYSIGTPKDNNEALKWLTIAAENQSDTDATGLLGKVLVEKQDNREDVQRGFQLLEKAAQTNYHVMFILGCFLLTGEFGRIDQNKGFRYISLAADHGIEIAEKMVSDVMVNLKNFSEATH